MINILSIYFIIVPFITGLFLFPQLNFYSRIVFFNISLSCIPQLWTGLMKDQALPVLSYNLYIIADCLLWFYYFYTLEKYKLKRKLIFALFIINSLLITYFFLNENIDQKFIYQLVCINSFLHLLNITNYFYSLSLAKEPVFLARVPSFWFSTGLFFYAACTFLIFFFYAKINSHFSKGELNQLWQIHGFFNFLMYLLFTIGLLKNKSHLAAIK